MGRPRKEATPVSTEDAKLIKVLDDAMKVLDTPVEPPKPKEWNKRYAELLSLYHANDGDEATQAIILATLDAVGLRDVFERLLDVDKRSNDELFSQLERAVVRLSNVRYNAENGYIKALGVLRSRCKEEE